MHKTLLMHIHTLKGCYFHNSALHDLYEMLSNFIVGSKLPPLSLYFEAHVAAFKIKKRKKRNSQTNAAAARTQQINKG